MRKLRLLGGPSDLGDYPLDLGGQTRVHPAGTEFALVCGDIIHTWRVITDYPNAIINFAEYLGESGFAIAT